MTVHVVAGIISHVFASERRYFLQQRAAHRDFPFTWESPGGKVEEGETSLQARVP